MVEVVTLPEVVVAVAVVSQGKTLRKQNNDTKIPKQSGNY